MPEPDWAAPRGPRPDGADVSPAPARRLARQSPGPVPCLSNASLPCLSSTSLAPAGPKSGSSHCLSSPAFHPGNPGPLRLGPPPRLEPGPSRCLSRRKPAHCPGLAEPASRLSGTRPRPRARPAPQRPSRALGGPSWSAQPGKNPRYPRVAGAGRRGAVEPLKCAPGARPGFRSLLGYFPEAVTLGKSGNP